MQHELLYRPSYAIVRMLLEHGESIRGESGAMLSMSTSVDIDSKMQGGIGKALGRMIGGESAFQTTFTAVRGPGEVLLAPPGPGDVMTIQLAGNGMAVMRGCYLASEVSLDVSVMKGAGMTLKGLIGGEGLFMISVTGAGTLFVNSYGAIHSVQLAEGQSYIVDTGHLVAFDQGMGYELRGATGLLKSITSGEGIVAQLTGPGTVHMQTRTPQGTAGLLAPFLPGRA